MAANDGVEQAIDFISPRIIAEFGRADLEQRLNHGASSRGDA